MTDMSRAEQAAAGRQAYELGTQRLTERDLAYNGLLDKHTSANPAHAPTVGELAKAHDTVVALAAQAAGRPFTDTEQAEWTSALGSQAAYYAAEEEGRAR